MRTIITFFTLSIASIIASAQYTPWHRVNAAIEANDLIAARSACVDVLIDNAEPDSILLMSRYILAEIADATADSPDYTIDDKLENVYRGYSFFRDYIKLHPDEAEAYSPLADRLKHTYDSLLAVDRDSAIPMGLFISAEFEHDEKKIPTLVLSVFPSGDKAFCTIHPMSDIANISEFKKAKIEFPSQIYTSDDNPDVFKAFWGNENAKKPNTALAQSTLNSAHSFQREMTSVIQSGNYSTGDYLAGTAATGAVTAGLVALANVFSSGSVNSYAVEFEWQNWHNGTLSLNMSMTHKKIKTGQSTPETESLSANVRLFKLYPHHEVLFYDHKSKSLIMPCVDDGIKKLAYLKTFHPAFRNGALSAFDKGKPLSKLKKVSDLNTAAINPLMYKYLFINGMLERAIEANDPAVATLPNIDKYNYRLRRAGYDWLRTCFEPIDGNGSEFYLTSDDCTLVIIENPKNSQLFNTSIYYTGYPVVQRRIATWYDENNGSTKGDGEIIYKNGKRFVGYTVNGDPVRGTLYISNTDTFEGTMVLEEYFNLCEPGSGTLTHRGDGFTCETVYTNGEAFDQHTIKYDNGDLYYGPIADYKPHGNGTMTYADGKTFKGEFADGKPVVKEKPKKRNRKKSRR